MTPTRLVPVFRVHDVDACAAWYARLGFQSEGVHQFEPGFPRYLFLRCGTLELHLSEHTGDAPPASLARLGVPDVDAVAARFGVEALTQPWGLREANLVDPAGNRLRVYQLSEHAPPSPTPSA